MKILAVRKKQLNPEIARSKNTLERGILISEQKVNFFLKRKHIQRSNTFFGIKIIRLNRHSIQMADIT